VAAALLQGVTAAEDELDASGAVLGCSVAARVVGLADRSAEGGGGAPPYRTLSALVDTLG